MASTILRIDYPQIPALLAGLEGFESACVLVYLAGRPVLKFWVEVRHGKLADKDLHRAFVKAADREFFKLWLNQFLQPENEPTVEMPARNATIAVCTRDRPEELESCLSAILKLPDDGQEVLVVDSCSASDRTRQVAESFPGVRYVLESLPGLNRARNRALHEARAPVVAFCDDDAQPEPGWLRALTEPFGDPGVLCVSGLTLPLELQTRAQEWFERTSPFGRGFMPKIIDKNSIHPLRAGQAGAGANMALRRDVTEFVGYFDEALDAGTPTLSGGDTEMFSRILAAGHRIVYQPRALSWHRHRREWLDLRKTIYGYGVGTYAVWTKQLLQDHEMGVFFFATLWLIFYQLPALIYSLLHLPDSIPFDLLLAELAGCFAGPGAYLRSRRNLNQEQAGRG